MGRFVCEKVAQRGAAEVIVPRRVDFDLTTESAVERLYATAKPDVVIHLAAEVGGSGQIGTILAVISATASHGFAPH